jgi:hypothetical protein
MIFDKTRWKEFIKGYSLFDCAIQSKDQIFLTLIENKQTRDIYPKTRFLVCYLDAPMNERFYFKEFGHFTFVYTAYATAPRKEFVAVDISGNVYSYDPDRDDAEESLESPWLNNQITKRNMCSSILSIKRVNGQIYALGKHRQLFLREGNNTWKTLSNTPEGMPFPMKLKSSDLSGQRMGHSDMSAFSPFDIYAAGGLSDLWHYNGKAWKQISFPSNELLSTICCAGDGKVYITGQNGSLWAGRDDRWKKLQDGEISLPFKDSEWFAGKLYCGNDYGLWVKDEQNQLIPLRDAFEGDSSMNSDIAMSSGRIDISPDGTLMLTAGPQGASLYDGKKWELLFNSNLMG